MPLDDLSGIGVVWATHRADGGCLIQSIKSVIQAGFHPDQLRVGEQVGKGLGPEHLAQLKEMGVSVEPSRYTRRDLFTDIVNRFRLVGNDSHDYVLNLDCDTLLHDTQPFLRAVEDGVAGMSACWGTAYFAGCTALYNNKCLHEAVRVLVSSNPLKFEAQNIPDDVAIGRLLVHLYGEDRVRRVEDGLLKRWAYAKDEQTLEDCWTYGATTFGDRVSARRLAVGGSVREVVANTMAECLAKRPVGV